MAMIIINPKKFQNHNYTEFNNAGLSKKRLKKASNVRLTENNLFKRQRFCSNMLIKIDDNVHIQII